MPQERKAEQAAKRGVCSQADFVGERFLPRFPTQGRRWLAAAVAPTERVQRLLCMPVRDLLPQISARSQMRDRCSKTACGYGARIQAFNYSHVGYGDAFFFTFRWLRWSPDTNLRPALCFTVLSLTENKMSVFRVFFFEWACFQHKCASVTVTWGQIWGLISGLLARSVWIPHLKHAVFALVLCICIVQHCTPKSMWNCVHKQIKMISLTLLTTETQESPG